MNIKKVSELTGVSADTIRYYERVGLIHPIQRTETGIRNFDEEDIRWINYARHMRHAGLSIESMTNYVSLFREGEHTIPQRKELIRQQMDELTEKIDALMDTRDRLAYKLANYEEHLQPIETSLREGEQVSQES
jgi:DNA-binding transcriptional MerR regulator